MSDLYYLDDFAKCGKYSDLMIKMIINRRIIELNEEINRKNMLLKIKNEKELYDPLPKNIMKSFECMSCSKIFYGYRAKNKLIQHCSSLNHKYV